MDIENEEFFEEKEDLNEQDKDFVKKLVDKLIIICNELLPEDEQLYPYQIPFTRRILESLIIDDGATLTALYARQSGKTESVALAVATAMIMFPNLAKIYPRWFGKFKNGVAVGAFAPVDEQADNLYGRIYGRLTSERALAIYSDPAIDEKVTGKGRVAILRNGSLVRKTTCHPKATIEGRTYHLIIVDECQGADERVINKSVSPMGAALHATKVFTGTPSYNKGIFFQQIKINKRNDVGRPKRPSHFQIDWREVAKYNPYYKDSIKEEIERIGEDSDEFRLSYSLHWILDKGMFTTSEKFDALGDTSMQSLVHAYHRTPVVAGIDCGRKQDKTIVTVVFVDWDNPDPFGLYHHRVLNWLDLEGEDWETQYFKIVEFLSNYNVWKIGIDVGGLGDVVAQHLKVLMPNADIVELGSANSDQNVRWKHLKHLMDNRQISWPAGAKVRRLKTFKRFKQEMEDLEAINKGPYFLAEAPKSPNAHDDYPDSLAMACVLTTIEDSVTDEVEVFNNVFYRRDKI